LSTLIFSICISGKLRDIFGSYGIVVLTIATLQVIATVLFCIALIYRRIDTNKKKKIQQKRRNTVFAITVSEL
jgi:large-conductance mechanosensitive channel